MEKKGNLKLYEEQISFLGSSELEPDSADNFATPYSCFKYFFTDETRPVTMQKLKRTIKISLSVPWNSVNRLALFIIYLPCVRDYWIMQNGVDAVRNVMTVNRFEKIREYLHINNNDE